MCFLLGGGRFSGFCCREVIVGKSFDFQRFWGVGYGFSLGVVFWVFWIFGVLRFSYFWVQQSFRGGLVVLVWFRLIAFSSFSFGEEVQLVAGSGVYSIDRFLGQVLIFFLFVGQVFVDLDSWFGGLVLFEEVFKVVGTMGYCVFFGQEVGYVELVDSDLVISG